jgi:hypothetical protein
LTKFVTAYNSRYANHDIFDIEMTISAHLGKGIMKLMDEEEGKQLVKRRLEVAREGRKRKQAERRQMMHKRGLRLQEWRDKLDPPSPSPEAQADITVTTLKTPCLTPMSVMTLKKKRQKDSWKNSIDWPASNPETHRIESSQNSRQCDSLLFFCLRLLEQRSALPGLYAITLSEDSISPRQVSSQEREVGHHGYQRT